MTSQANLLAPLDLCQDDDRPPSVVNGSLLLAPSLTPPQTPQIQPPPSANSAATSATTYNNYIAISLILEPSNYIPTQSPSSSNLKRQFSLFHNFGLSFSSLSALASITPLLATVLANGGPAVMIWGWFLVSIMMCFLALAMAELCAAYPVSAGLYYWSAVLGGRRYGPFFAWITAWFNIMGWIALSASFDYACADTIWSLVSLFINSSSNYYSCAIILFIFLGLLIVQGVINTSGHKLLPSLNQINVVWHMIGTAIIIIALSVASASSPVLRPSNPLITFQDQTGLAAVISSSSSSPSTSASPASSISAVYAAAIGLLQAQYTYTGFDASAHNCDETINASTAGPTGILMSVGVAAIVGWAYIFGLVFSIRDYTGIITAGGGGGGVGALYLFTSNLGLAGGTCLMVIVMVAMFFAGMFAITTTSRILFAFSRDKGLPWSGYWHTLSPHTHMPTRATWLTISLAFLITTPSLFSATAFTAITSIATIGLFISYVIPVILRRTIARKWFQPGLYTASFLGPRQSLVAGWIGIMWVGFVSILFILPTQFPVTVNNFNYAPVMVVLVGGGSMGSWWLGGMSKRFKGPYTYVHDEEELELERR